LYDEYNTRLYRVALLLCHGAGAMAEDAVAETFVRLYRVWSKDDHGIENFFAYARRALVNQVMGQYRSQKVADTYVHTHRADDRGERSVEEHIADAAATFETLQQLPPRQRTAVVLRYYEDLSYEQIATAMDVSVGTAKSQVSLGLAKMRELMGAGEP
jgi:RNA polymerase sigma factor (sigma-70 family)